MNGTGELLCHTCAPRNWGGTLALSPHTEGSPYYKYLCPPQLGWYISPDGSFHPLKHLNMKAITVPFSKQNILVALCCWFNIQGMSNVALSDSILFSIFRNGKMSGQLMAQRMNCPQGQKITLSSRVKSRMVFEVNVVQCSENIMSGGILISCLAQRKVNGATSINNRLEYKNGYYQKPGNGNEDAGLPGKICFTVSLLYFREPVGCRNIYSEFGEMMLPLKELGNGVYRLIQSGGKYTEFQYRDGLLVKVLSKTSFGDFVFVRQ